MHYAHELNHVLQSPSLTVEIISAIIGAPASNAKSQHLSEESCCGVCLKDQRKGKSRAMCVNDNMY